MTSISYANDNDTTALVTNLSYNYVDAQSLIKLNGEYAGMQNKIEKSSEVMLAKMKKQECLLKNELQKKDSTRAQQLFANSESIYKQLESKLKAPLNTTVPVTSLNCYIPKLDSMVSALNFIKESNSVEQLTQGKLQQLQALSGQLQQLQGKLQVANDIQNFVSEREQQLRDQLSSYGLSNKLLGINKTVYYYQQQLEQYKETLNDRQKIQDATLNAVRNLPAFQRFLLKNSWLSKMFPIPATITDTSKTLTGVNTKASIEKELKQRFGSSSGADPVQYMQKQVVPAQSQISQIQDKINSLLGVNGNTLGNMGSSTNIVMPEFNPNGQKLKKFIDRLEYGFNVQSQQTNYLLPATSQFALTVGYKISDKVTTGIGASYNLGWGNSIDNIHLSSQGVSLRSFLDIKLNGNIWLSGGYEKDYLQVFSTLPKWNDLAWQNSGLIGLLKKYTIGKKTNTIQLLWDFLSYEQIPKAQPLVFRVGCYF